MSDNSKIEAEANKVPALTADERLLHSLGYKQEFKREFTRFEVFGISFSIIGLLPSIASVLFFAVPNGGPVGLVWGWLIASCFILTIGMAMAELASAAPTSGGLYFWTYKYASPETRNLLCWLVGYSNTVGSAAAVASIDWGCAVQVMAAATIGSNDQSFVPTSGQTYAVYLAIIFAHALICSLGTRVLARLQNLYVALNIGLCLALIIALPVLTPKSLKNNASFALGAFTNLDGWPDWFAFMLSWLAPAWTIGGFDSAVHMSEEATNAATAVPWAIVGAVAISSILGTAINVVLAFCAGSDMSSVLNSPIGQPMATIIFGSLGPNGTLALWSVIVTVQFMMGSSMLLASSRQTFAFSRDGALPMSRYLYRINGYTQTPVNTVWFSGSLAALLGLLAFAGPSATNALFSLSVVGSNTAYMIPIGLRFIYSRHTFVHGPFSLGRWSLPVAITSILFMIFINIIFFFPTSPQTTTPSMNYSVVVMSGVTFGSLVWYYFPVYGGVHWFTGPVRTVEGDLSIKGSTVVDVDQIEGEKDKKDTISDEGSS
ncbi:amino acid/polyamine transporter I [Gautieria morchelliformis]|nr:amino acid/polyamine transporter I [Gautieria morchelliformis]